MIQGVFFDLGWTLETPETGDWMLTEVFREYCPQEMQDSVKPELWKEALWKASEPLIRHHKIFTLEEEEEQFTGFYYTLLSHAGLTVTEDIARTISHDRTYRYEKYIYAEDTEETLKQLKKQGYKLGVISDTWPSTAVRLQEAGLSQYFDCFTYSYQLGIFKPDLRMFEDALRKMNLQAEETVFADDLAKNLEAAASLGIHPVLSLLNPKTKPDERFAMIHSPSGIFDVPDLL